MSMRYERPGALVMPWPYPAHCDRPSVSCWQGQVGTDLHPDSSPSPCRKAIGKKTSLAHRQATWRRCCPASEGQAQFWLLSSQPDGGG